MAATGRWEPSRIMVDAGPAPVSLSFGKKTKTIYEGRNMHVGNNTIPRPDNILVASPVCLRSLRSLTGVPPAPWFQQASTFSWFGNDLQITAR